MWYSLQASEIIFLPQLLILAVFALFSIGVAATKPKWLWPLLIIVVVGTSGIMINGLSWVDEILAGCLLAGVFMRIAIKTPNSKNNQRKNNGLIHLHKLIFFVFIGYMIIQSVRGALFLESPRKLLWVFFFGMLGLLSIIISQKKYPVPSVRKISFIISCTALGYFFLITIYGLYGEVFRGISRWYLQTVEFGSSAYLMFPVAITMCVFFNMIKDKSRIYRKIGWITFIIILITSVYYDSRVALLTIAAFLIISLTKIGFRKFILLLCLCGITLIFLISYSDLYKGDFNYFFTNVFSSGSSIYKETGGRDIDRLIYIKVAFMSISDSWKHLFLGYGLRSHSTVIASNVKDLFAEYLPERFSEIEYREKIGTEGFTAYVVDTGLIGLLLLVTNFLFVARAIFIRKQNPHRIFLLLSLFLTFMWLFVINLSDNTLFYLMIMPSGLLIQLSNYRNNKKLLKKDAPSF